MLWSRYNRLFQSERYGFFLYNALSNTLLQVDETYYRTLEELRDCGTGISADGDDGFLAMLRGNKILVEEGEEERLLLELQYQRHAHCFDTSTLGLAICPTLRCNFRCPYCFEESQRDGKVMPPETIARLLTFIQGYKDIKRLSITWYGGEPTLAFHVIRELTEKFQALDLDFEGAALVTNGYLLDRGKIARLNELQINTIQITLDGPQEVHDTRRVLPGGAPTFQRILENVTALLDSPYEGACDIRVNIDKNNISRYVELRASLLERFKGKKLFVYPGQVHTSLTQNYDHACSLNGNEWADFNLSVYRQAGVLPLGGFYPSLDPEHCVATTHQAFVIGPDGEIYKCWEDVGKPGMVIGDIHAVEARVTPEPEARCATDSFWRRKYVQEPFVTNPGLRAQYSTGTDPYSDPVCRTCDVLPICRGGCPNKRLRTKVFGEQGLEFCSTYRNNLIPYLEAYFDGFYTKELCAAILSPGAVKQDAKGYRVVSPEKNKGPGK